MREYVPNSHMQTLQKARIAGALERLDTIGGLAETGIPKPDIFVLNSILQK